jgi:hypothetical protein
VPESAPGAAAPPEVHPAEAAALEALARVRRRQAESGSPSTRAGTSVSPLGEAWLDRVLKIAGVPDIYLRADWDKVRSRGVRDWTLTIEHRTRRRSDPGTINWQLLGHGLIIVGPVGTGKSSAAALCAREAARIERTVLWHYVPDLLDSLANVRARPELVRRLSHVDLLILDDLGVRDVADWEVGYLDQIVHNRYEQRKPMVITTNIDLADLKKDQRFERMADRWRERTARDVAILAGASMRSTA